MEHKPHQTPMPEMHLRPTTMEDGRYLIYYTFDEKPAAGSSEPHAEKPEPHAVPIATEEPRV